MSLHASSESCIEGEREGNRQQQQCTAPPLQRFSSAVHVQVSRATWAVLGHQPHSQVPAAPTVSLSLHGTRLRGHRPILLLSNTYVLVSMSFPDVLCYFHDKNEAAAEWIIYLVNACLRSSALQKWFCRSQGKGLQRLKHSHGCLQV